MKTFPILKHNRNIKKHNIAFITSNWKQCRRLTAIKPATFIAVSCDNFPKCSKKQIKNDEEEIEMFEMIQ